VTENAARANGDINAIAYGGGIENASGAVLHLVLSSVDNNEATALNATNQNGAVGGGIDNDGTLTLDRSSVDSNQALAQAGTGGTTNAFGGGISNGGPLTVRRSTVSNNAAIGLLSTTTNSGSGGGIANGNSASVDTLIDRSTISNNTINLSAAGSDSQGGGMLAFSGVEVRSSTIAHNTSSGSSNLLVWGSLSIKNSIVSDPEGAGAVNCTSFGTISSQGFNMADDASCSLTAPSDHPSTDPMLAPGLAANGGPTKTYALDTGSSMDPPSPAIDSGLSAGGETVDQRGSMRPSDFLSIPNAAGSNGSDIGAFEVLENEPPNTIIDSGPAGATSDPTPTFSFHATEAGSTFQCKVDAGAFVACVSPRTTVHLADGSHTFQVRAKDPAGNTDASPAARSFQVKTVEVKRSGSTLLITAGALAKDNLQITRPSPTTIRVTDMPAGTYTGSGVHATGVGCARSGDYTVTCNSSPITQIKANSAGLNDRVTNVTALPAVLGGGSAADILIGGSGADAITGGSGADTMRGMNGGDLLQARDLASDTLINCDGGSIPGSADKADLDLLPKDPDSRVLGCETKTRH
jgi:hypothetical protein